MRESAPAATPAAGTRTTPLLIALVLAVAVVAVYAPALRAGFVTADDGVYVTQNPTVQAGLTGAGLRWAFGFRESNWMPLTWASFMLDASLAGTTPRAFHLTNVLLHLASTLVLLLALSRMTGCPGRAGVVAMLFALHPLHVESVAWVAERKDVLSGLFWMLGLVAWTAYAKRPTPGRYALAAAAVAFGLMAKPMVVTLPLVFLLLDMWPLRRARSLGSLVREKLPLLALSAVASIATIAAQKAGGAMSSVAAIPLGARAGNAIVSYAAYLRDAVWPSGLAFFYPHPGAGLPAWQVVTSAAVLIAITVVAWRTIRTHPYVAIGWAWYVITLVPVIGIVQVGLQARADRYTYLPLIGPFIAVTWALADVIARVPDPRRRATIGAAAALACGLPLAVAAHAQAATWHDGVTVARHALAVTKDNAVAHNDLALALLERGDLDGAIEHARAALRLNPGHPEAPNHLATALVQKGRPDDAVAVYLEALALRPGDVTLHSNLGAVLAEQGRFDEAAAQFDEALRIDPNSSDAHYNKGILLARQQRYDAAVAELVIAQRLSPFDAEIARSLEQARTLARATP